MVYRITEARLQRDRVLRERILDCALQQVAEAGFASLAMTSLARSAGVATGSLYRHFSGKDEIAREIFTRATDLEVSQLRQQLQAPGTAAERLHRGIRTFAARAWHSRQLAFALIAEPVPGEVDACRLHYREIYAELFSQLLEQGNRDGSLQVGNIPLTAACLVGATAEALVGPLSPQAIKSRAEGDSAADFEQVCSALLEFCLRAVAARLD